MPARSPSSTRTWWSPRTCARCAPSTSSTVDDALTFLGCRAEVATLDPHTLDDVLASIVEVGRLTGRSDEAAAVVASLEARLAAVAARVAGRPRPRVLVLEWTDPPFAPGHWIPEMVTRAGGEPSLGVAGTKSSRITWDEAVASRPDVVVCAPCGFDLDGSTALAEDVRHRFPGVPVWPSTPTACSPVPARGWSTGSRRWPGSCTRRRRGERRRESDALRGARPLEHASR